MDPVITSLQNPKIKEVVKLRDRRARDESGLFLIEGYRELKRALDAGRAIQTLFYCPELFLGSNEGNIKNQCKAALHCSKDVFAKISYRDRPDGLLAVAPQMHLGLADLQLKENPFLLVAEGIEKPGNLGTILRSCDAAGVDGVVVCDPTTDIHNPNVVRSSVGTLFTLPVLEASTEETLQFLKGRGIAIVAATPHAAEEFTQADFKGPLAIVVGTEQYGLSKTWMDEADIRVRIPMLGVADSLNVASATTLLLYEVVRQRRL
ncbi:MAG: RNA methyltransferase [Verrucomicrobia bacterium]|nr:RNA methyltransferase [Verrucomicrobiota bacterium]MBU6447134.1 RNA methyltransferase [Verrucomicrobiota bacterium]